MRTVKLLKLGCGQTQRNPGLQTAAKAPQKTDAETMRRIAFCKYAGEQLTPEFADSLFKQIWPSQAKAACNCQLGSSLSIVVGDRSPAVVTWQPPDKQGLSTRTQWLSFVLKERSVTHTVNFLRLGTAEAPRNPIVQKAEGAVLPTKSGIVVSRPFAPQFLRNTPRTS